MNLKGLYLFLLLSLTVTLKAAEWQWSVQIQNYVSSETNDHPRAFLWIPENCKQVRAVVIGNHNMLEEGILEHPGFRKKMAYRSVDGENWIIQPGGTLLPDDEGTGIDDIPNALHANVVISNDRAYMHYFTHLGRTSNDKKKDTFEQRRTSIQVVELELSDADWITANRNKPTYVKMSQE